MRLRTLPGSKEQIAEHSLLTVAYNQLPPAGWHQKFALEQPIHLEIGMGRGRFITGLTRANPHINYIGLEVKAEVILTAIERLAGQIPPNLLFLHGGADNLAELLPANSIEQIYLLFSDPWPKKRHHKRRLTDKRFLDQYAQVLGQNGRLIFKTDGEEFFAWSRQSFCENGWQIIEESHDYQLAENEIISEYENRFRQKGQPIFYALLTPPKDTLSPNT